MGGVRYQRRCEDRGRLTLTETALIFKGHLGTRTFPLARVTGVTIESNTVIVGLHRSAAHFFRFAGGTGKRWEDTLRRMPSLGVPLVPVGISGSYTALPRWTHHLRRGPVTVRFGPPVHLPPLPPHRQTDGVIKALEELLRRRIQALIVSPGRAPFDAGGDDDGPGNMGRARRSRYFPFMTSIME